MSDASRTRREPWSRRGYMFVVLAISSMALFTTITATQQSGQLYEVVSVTQAIQAEQARWLAEGLLNHQMAVAVKQGNGAWTSNWNNTVRQPSAVGMTAGQLFSRDATLRFQISLRAFSEPGGGGTIGHEAHVLLMDTVPIPPRCLADRLVARRGTRFTTDFSTGAGNAGLFVGDH